MKKYANPRSVKFTVDNLDYIPSDHKSISKLDKLVTRNANRSLKKRMRQDSKREIAMLLEEDEQINTFMHLGVVFETNQIYPNNY